MSIDGLKKQHLMHFYAVLFLFSAVGDLPAVVPNLLLAKFIYTATCYFIYPTQSLQRFVNFPFASFTANHARNSLRTRS